MSTPTFVVFVGAGGPLSLALKNIENRQANTFVVAPAMKKSDVGLNSNSINFAIESLKSKLDMLDNHRESARLLVFLYEGFDREQFKSFWMHLGRAAWVEFVPITLLHKVSPTRLHIEHRIKEILPLLHFVSAGVFKDRRRTALPLPIRNYQCDLVRAIDHLWYKGFDANRLKLEIGKLQNRFSSRWVRDREGFRDDRDLIFKPCKPSQEHGIAHPQGASAECFVAGRFRFGAALSPGFHYDVEGPRKNQPLEATLCDCRGDKRDLRPEKRNYINIHPNDYLRPAN